MLPYLEYLKLSQEWVGWVYQHGKVDKVQLGLPV